MIIDTHCHLDDERYREDLETVLDRARGNGINKMIIPGATPETLERAVYLSEMFDEVYFAVGVHPNSAREYKSEILENYIQHNKCVAVGECGLDYYRLTKDEEKREIEKSIQKDIFISQIELANKFNKPLIIHIRDASRDAQEILEKYSQVNGVLHCYNADHQLLKLADKGFYFGIGGVLTFKNAKKLVDIYPKIPKDRLLIETDAPYLTPHPHRGKRNEPAFCKLVAEKMANLSDIDIREIENITTENAKRLFRI